MAVVVAMVMMVVMLMMVVVVKVLMMVVMVKMVAVKVLMMVMSPHVGCRRGTGTLGSGTAPTTTSRPGSR